MNDPWVTQQIQVRDLLIHNAGLREGSASERELWPEPNPNFARADILAGLGLPQAATKLPLAIRLRQSDVRRGRRRLPQRLEAPATRN